jgi:hypothetical protein
MKTISIVMGLALLIISGILIFLLKSGVALKPAGVIKPAEIGANPEHIGKSVAVRLFPEFHAVKNTIWYVESDEEPIASLPLVAYEHLKLPVKPNLQDLRRGRLDECPEKCWYIVKIGTALPEELTARLKAEESVEIYVQHFKRDEQVPEACEKEKILEPSCVKPVTVREVRRKLKTQAPYYFMQRYQKHEFYLLLEKQ